MVNEVPKSFLNLFHIFCLATTIGFIGWCISEYSLDHDYTETTFASFHETPDDIYPSVTICDMDPMMEEKYDVKFRKIPIIKEVYGKRQDVNIECVLHSKCQWMFLIRWLKLAKTAKVIIVE